MNYSTKQKKIMKLTILFCSLFAAEKGTGAAKANALAYVSREK